MGDWVQTDCVRIEGLESRRLLAVVISEFLASNSAGLRDEDGDRSDWVELYNDGPAPADLTGWYLTDNDSQLTKWQFPATTIPAGGYLVVFASSKNRAVSGQELHTNFALSADGEDLLLVRADGSTVEDAYIAFPAQKAEVSFGRGIGGGSSNTETLVGASTAVRAISPTAENAAVDDHFREIGFDDSTWHSGTRSVGFDRDGTLDFTPYIGLTLSDNAAGMPSTSSPRYSAYIRFPFTVNDPSQFTSLSMDLRFDDGFIAYLNGREIKRVNFGEDFVRSQPQWDSRAGYQLTSSTISAANRGAEALTPVTFDLTAYLSTLQHGDNVLAFHGVNSASTANSSANVKDFLIEPVLQATRAGGAVVNGTFMPSASPGSANGVGLSGVVGDTHFSVDRGFFTAPFQTAITTDTPGASIRYTLDGSLPSETTGTLYTGPVTISQTTTLRAIAYKSGFKSTNVDTQTYIFLSDVIQQNAADITQPYATWGHDKDDADAASGVNLDDESDWEMDPDIIDDPNWSGTIIDDLKAIPTMSVVMDWNDLFGGTPQPGSVQLTTTVSPSPQGIYIAGRSDERYMSLEYFNPNSPGDEFHLDAAIEIQGHSSPNRWNSDKMSFQVKFKYPYGPTELNYPIFSTGLYGPNATSEFDTFILDAMYNNTWHHGNHRQSAVARFVSDQALADLHLLAGGYAPRGRFVHLYLNGLYWGIYNVHERPDDSFAAEYLGGDKDDYDVVKHASDDPIRKYTWVEGGVAAENAFAALVTATRAVDSDPTNSAKYQAVKDVLDVDDFITYMVVNYYGGNVVDWSNNNWYATKNRVDPAGRWRFHTWDGEHAFPTDDNASLGDTVGEDADATNFDQTETPTELHRNLIGNAEYRLRFADIVQKLMHNDGILTPAKAAEVFQARIGEIDRAIVGESARWGDNRVPINVTGTFPYTRSTPYTRDDWVTTMNGVLADFFPVRTGIVLGQFDSRGWLPTLDAPLFNQHGGEISPGFLLTLSLPGGSPGGAKIYYTTDGTDPRLEGGALSASAIEYTGPVQLNTGAQIRARVYFDNSGVANDWSPIVDATFVTAGGFPVRIVELHYHPANHPQVTDDEDLEFIELLNTGAQTVSLQGVQITQFISTPYVFGAGISLAPGERIVVARNPAVLTSIYGSGINAAPVGYGTGNLSNGGERIALLGPLGETIQDFTYDDVAPWPTAPDGNGPSLEIIDPLGDPSNASNWRASTVNGGTPGAGADTAPPTILSAAYNVDTGKFIVQFSESINLATLQAADLTLQPQPSGTEVAADSYQYDGNSNTATFSFASPPPDGNYRIRLAAGSFSDAANNPLASDYLSATFFLLAGDANGDRAVNTLDFNVLAFHFGGSGKVFSEGNLDYDPAGAVDSLDFNVFTGQYGKTLPAAGTFAPLAASLFNELVRDGAEDDGTFPG